MRVLIIKMSSLGDIIHVFPALDLLSRAFSEVKIDWVVEKPFAELLQAHPNIDQVLIADTRRWRRKFYTSSCLQEMRAFIKQVRQHHYDIVFDLQGNVKSSLVLACTQTLRKVGFSFTSVAERPNLLFTNECYCPPAGQSIRDDYLFLIRSAIRDFKTEATGKVQLKISAEQAMRVEALIHAPELKNGWKLLVCPGSIWENKKLSFNVLKEFLKKIQEECQGRFLFAWGSNQEKDEAHQLASFFPNQALVLDKLALPMLQHLMMQVDGVLAMDSLPLHLTGTTATPVYAVFGASSGVKYMPHGTHYQVFQGSCPYGRTFEKRCPILRSCLTGACIKEIDPKVLFDHFYSAFFQPIKQS